MEINWPCFFRDNVPSCALGKGIKKFPKTYVLDFFHERGDFSSLIVISNHFSAIAPCVMRFSSAEPCASFEVDESFIIFGFFPAPELIKSHKVIE